MSRLIDADALIHELNNSHCPGAPYVDAGISIAIGKVCDAPTIDTVRNGKWIHKSGTLYATCSECGVAWGAYVLMNYCPNCGVKMEEGEQE